MLQVSSSLGLRRILLLISAALLLSSLGFASRIRASSGDGAEVTMQTTSRNFGDVFAGEELEQNFPIQNTGTKPLELSQKSSLSAIQAARPQDIAAAVWHPGSQPLVRTVAARRAAPS